MKVKSVFSIGVIIGCILTSGYMLAAEKTPESSGYKILTAPAGGPTGAYNTWGSVVGPGGIPKDFLKGCVPISISTMPNTNDPRLPFLLILCKG